MTTRGKASSIPAVLGKFARWWSRLLASLVVLPTVLLGLFLVALQAENADARSVPAENRLGETSAMDRAGAPATAFLPKAFQVTAPPHLPRQGKPVLSKGTFLVASRKLKDPNFAQTVVLLVEHNDRGAMGLVVNRPTNLALSMVLPAMEELEKSTATVFVGGPVAQDQMVLLIRAETQPDESEHVFEDVYVSGSRAALQKILTKVDSRDRFHAYVGYAGWAPGQLEGEVARGDWVLSSASASTVFDTEASEVWPELIRRNSGLWVKGVVPTPAQAALGSMDLKPRCRQKQAFSSLVSAGYPAY